MRLTFLRYRCALIFKIGSRAILQIVTFMKPICLLAIAAVVTICSSNFYEVSGQVQERSRWLLPDVAKVTLDSSGQSQIDFNPTICRRLGPDLCEYFRAHEYGHVNLRHLERGVPTRQAEREADLWAAQNASPSAVEAARKYFERGRGGSFNHGSARVRAQRLKDVQASQQAATSLQKRVTVLKPSISSTTSTTSATTRNPTQYSAGSTTTVTRQPVKYVTNGGTANTTSTAKRSPTQYSGGSRKAVVRKAIPHSAKRVVYIVKSAPSKARSYVPNSNVPKSKVTISNAPKVYVPKGGFNNPR